MSLITALTTIAKSTPGQEQLTLPGVTYPNDLGYVTNFNTTWLGLMNYQFSPLVWRILDKTFISISQGDVNYYLFVFDHFTNKVSNAINTGLSATGSDVHHRASIIGTALNELFITETSFHGPSGTWKISKSGVGYDINNFNAWTGTGVNEFTYHQLKVMSNGDIYNIGRTASTSGGYSYLDLYKSTNNGTSFSSVGRVLDWGSQAGPDIYISYLHMIYSNDEVMRVYVNRRRSNPVNTPRDFQVTYYMESHDYGTTWRNVNNTFSKDIVTNGGLSLSEMDANMIAWQLPTNTDTIRAMGSNMINGNPYFIGGSGDVASSELALYYWSGSAWVQKVITCAGHTFSYVAGPGFADDEYMYSGSIFNDNGNLGLIAKEIISTVAQYSRFRSTDNGDTWAFVEQLTSDAANHMGGQLAHNSQDFTDNVFCCLKDVGSSNWNLFVERI